MGEIEKLKIRLKHQNISAVARQASVGRATIYRMQKSGTGDIEKLDKINAALDHFGVRRVSEKDIAQ